MGGTGRVDVRRLAKLLKDGATLREAARLLGIEDRRSIRYAVQKRHAAAAAAAVVDK